MIPHGAGIRCVQNHSYPKSASESLTVNSNLKISWRASQYGLYIWVKGTVLCNIIKGTVPQKSMWALKMFIFQRRQQWYHLFGCETHANRAITTQSWDYFVCLRNLAVHKDHLPHHRMTLQSALLLWLHLLTVGAS